MLAVATVASTVADATLVVTSTKPEPVLAATLTVVEATATVALAVAETALLKPPVTVLASPPKKLELFFGSGLGSSFGAVYS